VGLYLVDVYKLNLVLEAFIFTMVTIVPWLPGQPLAGVIGDRIGHRKVVVYSLLGAFLIMGILTSLVALYGTIPLPYAIVLLAGFWACTSGLVNAWPLTTELFSPRAAGTVAGMMNTGGNLAGAIVAVVAGYFIAPGSSFVPVFAIGAVVAFVGLTAALLLPSKRLHAQPE
jgi:MFS family permease